MKSSAPIMVCPKCENSTNCWSVGAHELTGSNLAPEYATTRNIGGKDYDVYKRVRQCAECNGQFSTFEITGEVFERVLDLITLEGKHGNLGETAEEAIAAINASIGKALEAKSAFQAYLIATKK